MHVEARHIHREEDSFHKKKQLQNIKMMGHLHRVEK